MKRIAFIKIVTLVLALSTVTLDAQVNIKIGYSVAQSFPKVNNQFIADLNHVRSQAFDDFTPMKDLGFMYGITLGVRYGIGIGNLEFSWERLSIDRKSIGIDRPTVIQQATASPYEISYSFNQLFVTYESRFGILGIGSSVGVNRVGISAPTTNSDDKDRLLSESQIMSRFHVSLNFEGNSSVAISLKPFIQIPLTDIDLSPAIDILDTATTEKKETFPLVGLSLIFYNGPQ